jgi:hypothetical protein
VVPVANLRQPVGPTSRLRPRPGVRAVEIDGHPALADAETGTHHLVSPAVTEIWSLLDGRTLCQLALDTGCDDRDRFVELTELLRRLRAFGLLEDVDVDADDGDDADADVAESA